MDNHGNRGLNDPDMPDFSAVPTGRIPFLFSDTNFRFVRRHSDEIRRELQTVNFHIRNVAAELTDPLRLEWQQSPHHAEVVAAEDYRWSVYITSLHANITDSRQFRSTISTGVFSFFQDPRMEEDDLEDNVLRHIAASTFVAYDNLWHVEDRFAEMVETLDALLARRRWQLQQRFRPRREVIVTGMFEDRFPDAPAQSQNGPED